MAFIPGVSGKVFGTLGANDINIRMIAQGPDEINIIVGVENQDFEKTIRVLYDSFIVRRERGMKLYNVAVLGATGAVGREMLKILEEHDFPVGELRPLASSRSSGAASL